ncbi:MAG: DNA-3-methyladenine glycosylase 2 family protein [Pseudomonadota bacterium]
MIRTDADVARGAAWLAEREPRFAEVLAQTGPLPLRLRPPGFAGLLDVIVSQQVSVASAAAIQSRLAQAGLTQESAVRAADETALCAAGLSRPKARYAHALARTRLNYAQLETLTDQQVFDTLTAQKGIGPWTAQIYLMFCLGRADIFPAGDLALQEAARMLFDLPARPSPNDLTHLALAWSPWRSVAARALFAYYRVRKQREGIG